MSISELEKKISEQNDLITELLIEYKKNCTENVDIFEKWFSKNIKQKYLRQLKIIEQITDFISKNRNRTKSKSLNSLYSNKSKNNESKNNKYESKNNRRYSNTSDSPPCRLEFENEPFLWKCLINIWLIYKGIKRGFMIDSTNTSFTNDVLQKCMSFATTYNCKMIIDPLSDIGEEKYVFFHKNDSNINVESIKYFDRSLFRISMDENRFYFFIKAKFDNSNVVLDIYTEMTLDRKDTLRFIMKKVEELNKVDFPCFLGLGKPIFYFEETLYPAE